MGLLFIAWSKDKIEDERTKQMKINALAGVFVFGAIYAVFTPVLNTYFGEPILETTGQGLMSLLLASHVGTFYGQKFDNWYDKRKEKHEKNRQTI